MFKNLIFIFVLIISMLFLYLFFSSPAEKNVLDHSVRSKSNYDFIKLSKGYTAYSIHGPDTGHPVVLIHGGTIPMCIWSNQIDYFTKAGFRVICYDQYGRGESDRPEIEYNRSLFTNQLKELLDSLKISYPVSLIGPSFGGAISVSFASKYPQLVHAIVLVSPAINLEGSDSPLEFAFQITRLPILGELVFRSIIMKKIIERGQTQITGDKNSPCNSNFLNQFTYKGTSDALYSMFISDAFRNYLEETRVVGEKIQNVLLIRGKKDKEITESMIKEIRSLLPECEFRELDSGHSPNADTSFNFFNQVVIEYIKKSISKEYFENETEK